ncbi:MAG: hypothetical protein EBR20_02425 [Bacteroidetes bacterium]|nr:hypothetical protein [Bacteroidota bacterium]
MVTAYTSESTKNVLIRILQRGRQKVDTADGILSGDAFGTLEHETRPWTAVNDAPGSMGRASACNEPSRTA